MPKVSRNKEILQQKLMELEFLKYAMSLGYSLMDFEVVERSEWDSLNTDQLKALKRNYNWTSGDDVYSLRWDWTNTIVQYQKKYQLKAEKIAYSGPVYSRDGIKDQLGMEIFSANIGAQQELLREAIEFIKGQMDSPITIAVLSHNKLLKKVLTGEQLEDPSLRRFIEARNAQGLAKILGAEHPLIHLMECPPHEQLDFLGSHFPELHRHIEELNAWSQLFSDCGIPHVYNDVLALPNQSYYRGIFFKAYHEEQKTPLLAGGQYTALKKAFGVGINTGNIILRKMEAGNGGSSR